MFKLYSIDFKQALKKKTLQPIAQEDHSKSNFAAVVQSIGMLDLNDPVKDHPFPALSEPEKGFKVQDKRWACYVLPSSVFIIRKGKTARETVIPKKLN